MEVSNGETRDSASQVAKLCGTELPKPITTSGPHLFLKFRSDSSMAFKGFKLRFTKTGMAFGKKLSAITALPKASSSLNASKILLVGHWTKIFRNPVTGWMEEERHLEKSFEKNNTENLFFKDFRGSSMGRWVLRLTINVINILALLRLFYGQTVNIKNLRTGL